ncbi:MAG: hypothetical protein K1V96_10715 [Lachnospiraceae bacterium]
MLEKDFAFTTICQRDSKKEVTISLNNMSQEEFEQLAKQYGGGIRSEQAYFPFSLEDAKKLARDDEEFIGKGAVDTNGFNQVVAFFMCLTERIWQITQKHQSFRMELCYDAKTLKTNYCFFVPTNKHVSDDTSLESLKS